MYTLYVIPGSHACRSAMLMLEHKQVPYRRVDIVTLMHPLVVRLHGFDAGGQTRTAGGRRTFGLRLGDRLGTVPALAANGQRISTNHGIARFLDERHPQQPLFPADPEQRAAVEEVERWANETLQMAARRIPGTAIARDPAAFSRSAGDGRLGYLLYKRALTRRLIIPRILREVFAAGAAAERELLAELPAMLDRIDAWIADGILGGPRLNAADFMVAPCLALILYRPDVLPLFEGRPALELVDRLLPEPALRPSDHHRHRHSMLHRRHGALGMKMKAAAAGRTAPEPEGVSSPPPGETARLDGGPRMRLPNTAHSSRPWRIHELTREFRLQDVWELPTPGGPDDFPRLVALFASLDPSRGSSRAVRTLFAIRRKVGELLHWDDPDPDPRSRVPTLRDRLPEDLREAPSGPHSGALPFVPLYLTEDEWAVEAVNRTVDGVLHLGWVPDPTDGYRGQMAVLVKPNGLLGTAYMAAITPFRHAIVYPQLLRDIEREWHARAGDRTPTT